MGGPTRGAQRGGKRFIRASAQREFPRGGEFLRGPVPRAARFHRYSPVPGLLIDLVEFHVQRRFAYASAGAMLSVGAPLGLVAVRLISQAFSGGVMIADSSESPSPNARRERGLADGIGRELAADCLIYLYVSMSTAVVFTAFGYLLGRQADRLARLSETDALTGLINARGLYERLRRELARARRYGTPLALLVLDLDGLKIINDRSGHRAGDEALRHCAEVVRSELRETDVGARWGGDEFAILAPDTSREAAVTMAERIRALIARRSTVSSPLSVSLGIAMLQPVTLNADALMHAADAAMYEAKLQGRNRVVMARSTAPSVLLPRGTGRRCAEA